MKKPLKSKLPAKLARGRRSFEKWRSTHKPRSRLPGHLWSVAEELAGEYGVSRAAHALGLDYYGLKKRIKPADFRKGIDGLARVCREQLNQDPFRGTVLPGGQLDFAGPHHWAGPQRQHKKTQPAH